MKIFCRRFLRRLRHAFRFSEMWNWEYESCNRCGSCYRISCGIQEEIWLKVNGQREGCLCFDCFTILAQEKNITFVIENIERLRVFDPNGTGFYILYPTMKFRVNE